MPKLPDAFSGTWRLLSETTQFLSQTRVFLQYEEQLRAWRRMLQSSGKNSDAAKKIRQEIIELRKALREEGYDLSLAGTELVIDRFRNDAAMAEGFRRAVVFFRADGVRYISGDENHITLADRLEKSIAAEGASAPTHSKHYLWFLRTKNALILSGSDTETKDDFERLKAMGEASSLAILAALKGLR